jgi:DNA-binding IclR family transcriptional regulator
MTKAAPRRATTTPLDVPPAKAGPAGVRTKGAQAIDRASEILRIVGHHATVGATLKQVVAASGLNKATAYRILRALIDNGLVEYLAEERTYRLGFEVFALCAAMGERFDLKALAQPALERLAESTEDTAYLAVRSGYDGLCVSMVEGAYPQKALRLNIGARWPLGVGTLNLAMIAYLPDAEVDEIIAHNKHLLEEQDEYAPAAIYRYIEETRTRGYAVKSSGVFPTMSGVGVPIFDAHRRPVAALSVIAIAARMRPERCDWIAQRLWAESRAISEMITTRGTPAPDSDLWRPGSPRRIIGWDGASSP